MNPAGIQTKHRATRSLWRRTSRRTNHNGTKVRKPQILVSKSDAGMNVSGFKSKGFAHRNSRTYITANIKKNSFLSLHFLRKMKYAKIRIMTKY